MVLPDLLEAQVGLVDLVDLELKVLPLAVSFCLFIHHIGMGWQDQAYFHILHSR